MATVSIKPICEYMTTAVKRIWREEADKMVKELQERVTARLLEVEQQLYVDYQKDVSSMNTTLHIVLPGNTTILDD